ncbi:MAG: hypothetical protein GX981_02745 [Tissierellia bacterium]|nr:hypothetical protein [Tissierellia bacterium]
MKKKNEPVRLNLQMSEEIIAFYQELAEEIGIPRSGVMVMALKAYMDQQKSLKMNDRFESWAEIIEQNKLNTKD